MNKLLFIALLLATCCAAAASDLAPTLEWVAATGGSGSSLVTAAAADGQGNLYIAGSTTSLDFPTTGATQTSAGGSLLTRIDLSTGNAHRLFPANLPAITAAAAAPSQAGTLYAASANQIFQSTDAGSTWKLLSQFPASFSVFGLAVDPKIATTIYAATATAGVQKSTDGGRTWAAINTGILPLPNGNINIGQVWIDPTTPNVLFAAGSLRLTRSSDAGHTWAPVYSGATSSVLAFDPFLKGTLYFGTGTDISKSTDNGATFVPLSSLPNQAQVYGLTPDPQHAGILYAGTSGGIYQSSDSGSTWSLKRAGVTTTLVGDPKSAALYANSFNGTVKSTNGFASASAIGPNQPAVSQLLVSGPNLFVIAAQTTDVFAVKLDRNGKVVYSTYFGGSGNDSAVALAVGSDGSLYVTGSTSSADLPVTPGAYLSALPNNNGDAASFVFKLNPSGSVKWATYFPGTGVAAMAVDANGESYIGGSTGGGLPTTAGAYQTSFQQTVGSNGFFGVPGPLSAFVTKFNAAGSGLVYSTYIPFDKKNNTVQGAQALVVDSSGHVWIGVPLGSNIAPVSGTAPSVVELNPTGSDVVASAVQGGLGSVTAIALDARSNVYVAGSYVPLAVSFPATPGAFQPAPQPVVPTLAYEPASGGGVDSFVAKWDSSLTHLLAATLLGGELPDAASSVAVDATGAVIVGGYTDSKAFPTRAPFQESFSSQSGFVAAFNSNLTNLLFSTYLGDGRPFAVAAAVPDGSGGILLAGSTMSPASGNIGAPPPLGGLIVANRIALAPAPAVRLDSVQNYASHLAEPLAPGEPILALGAGFGSAAQIVVDGSPLATVSSSATSLVAVMPDTAANSGLHTVTVSNGSLSNPVYVPSAATSPAIYTVDRSGAGQGYIRNSDGTLNSPSNPAAAGSAITIFAAGAGQYSVSNGYAVTAQTPAVFIDGFYCAGIAAVIGPVQGLPGNVYQLSVYVPQPAALAQLNPDLKNFTFPPQSFIQLVMGPVNSSNPGGSMASQIGVFINIK